MATTAVIVMLRRNINPPEFCDAGGIPFIEDFDMNKQRFEPDREMNAATPLQASS